MRSKRRSAKTSPFKTGDRIRPIGMFEHHRYKIREIYVVTQIDRNDSTLKARNAEGVDGSWIRWSDCERVEDIGWDWLKGELTVEALELLSAFEGMKSLSLRADIRKAIVMQTSELKKRILNACETLESSKPQS
jgi:hypothetical protein